MRADWLIVGAGFTGCVLAERIASQLGQSVLIVERRDHIGGNAFDHPDEHGIQVHRYGPHIFHTNSRRVWDYLSAFTEWRPYQHRVLGHVQGVLVPLPFNLTSLERLFPPDRAARLGARLIAAFKPESQVPILVMRETPDPEIRALADFIYEHIFLRYTMKMWGVRPEHLEPSVTARVPVRIGHDDRYFLDTYQAMPREGYAVMFRRMVAHPKIELLLGTDYRREAGDLRGRRTIYTGPIDAYFDYMHGPLPYRSIRFQFEHRAVERAQEVATINFPNAHEKTRTTEFKHLTGQAAPSTTLVSEYPQPHVPGQNEPYYPVLRDESRERFLHYRREVDRLKGSIVFAGRLADYQYYNMDQAVARALKTFDTLVRRP